jgi:talin
MKPMLFSVQQNTQAHPAIDEAAESMKDAIQDLKNTVEQEASESGVVSGLVDSISKTLTSVSTLYIHVTYI